MSHPTGTPSALSILLSRYAGGVTPRGSHSQSPPLAQNMQSQGFTPHPEAMVNQDMSTRFEVPRFASPPVTEATPLLQHPNGSVTAMNGHPPAPSKYPKSFSKRLSGLVRGLIGDSHKIYPQELGRSILKCLPPVLLGTLLNILDGVSCRLFILIDVSSLLFSA